MKCFTLADMEMRHGIEAPRMWGAGRDRPRAVTLGADLWGGRQELIPVEAEVRDEECVVYDAGVNWRPGHGARLIPSNPDTRMALVKVTNHTAANGGSYIVPLLGAVPVVRGIPPGHATPAQEREFYAARTKWQTHAETHCIAPRVSRMEAGAARDAEKPERRNGLLIFGVGAMSMEQGGAPLGAEALVAVEVGCGFIVHRWGAKLNNAERVATFVWDSGRWTKLQEHESHGLVEAEVQLEPRA
jgi:hypothetical protein